MLATVPHLALALLLSLWCVAPCARQGTGVVLDICDDLGCGHQTRVGLDSSLLARLDRFFVSPPADALAERRRIRQAIAWLERQAGSRSPIHLDRGRNPDIHASLPAGGVWPLAANRQAHPDVRGQLDCVAESRNTTRFLELLAARGLLRFHRVLEPAFRAPRVFDQHWSAQIAVRADGRRYVVDSWFLDNGEPPYIQRLGAWLGKQSFPPDGVE